MIRKCIKVLVILLVFLSSLLAFINYRSVLIGTIINKTVSDKTDDSFSNNEGGIVDELNPLTIASLRVGNYPGSKIVIEEKLDPGSNYDRFLTSYRSEGLKIYALLTIPQEDPSTSSQNDNKGLPVIVFNHGYIPPKDYRTTERYIAYVDGFARNGYIVFRPDYRGHGDSEGDATGAYGSNAYTIDVLNAVASVKRLGGVDVNRIGMWGHSMGGFITLRSMVVSTDIKAGVIWAGVVGSYPDMINNWRRNRDPYYVPPTLPQGAKRWRDRLVELFGEPLNDSPFWQSISANFFLNEISGPLSLHHGTADESVPAVFSQTLYQQMKTAGKTVELYTYDGDDHNISANFSVAMQRSIEFFDKYLK